MLTREKLVRDKIPELIRKNGQKPRIRIASNKEMDRLLRAKIVEEAQELLESGKLEEVADICEAMDAFLKHRDIKTTTIDNLRKEKKKERGAFTEGYVLIT